MSDKVRLSDAKDRIIAKASPEIARFLAGSVLRRPSSVELGWKNLALERRTILPSDFPELVLNAHFLILWEGHIAEGETASGGGQFATYKKYPGTVSTCHPGIRPALRNRSSHEVIVAALEPQFMTSLEEELEVRPSEPLQDLHGTGDPDLTNLIRLLLNESDAGGPYGTLYADSLTAALATRLMVAARIKKFAVKTAGRVLPSRVLRRVTDRMRADLATDLDLATLATESGYSRAHFLRTFKATTGQTPHRYLNELRLLKARDLLLGLTLPLIEIAEVCGFSSQPHLSTAFRSRFGMSPGEYRRDHSKARG
jgi:AraC family transcriptional regulator